MAVVEPGLVQDVPHRVAAVAGAMWKARAISRSGNDALADQVKDLSLPGSEAGWPGEGIRRQPIRDHFDHRVGSP